MPTFPEFVAAASRLQPRDALALKGETITKRLPYEEDGSNLNRRTWAAFKSALIEWFPKTRRYFISARYNVDPVELERSGSSLQRRQVEYFGVGAETVFTYNLSEKLRVEASWWPFRPALSDCTPDHLFKLHQEAVRPHFVGKEVDPSQVSGAPHTTHENLTTDLFERDRQRAILYRGVADLTSHDPNIPRNHPYYSRLCMGIISLLETDPKLKDLEIVIPAPGAQEGKLDYYKVHEIVSHGGLTAVALVPISKHSSLEPILAFRCTKQTFAQDQAVSSMLNDLEVDIGRSGYEASRQALNELVKDPKFAQGKKFKVLCYSLGGAHATYFMQEHWRKVSEFIGFNITGCEASVVESLAKEMNDLPEHDIPPPISLHRNVGDWVNKAGRKHIGWGLKHPKSRIQLMEWTIKGLPIPEESVYDPVHLHRWLVIHGVRPMDSVRTDELEHPLAGTRWKYRYNVYRGPTVCTPLLDTYKRDGGLENKRLEVHQFLYKLIQGFYSFVDFIIRAFGFELFK